MAPGEATNISTSILYHGFGIRGCEYVRCQFGGGELRFTIQQPRKSLRFSALKI